MEEKKKIIKRKFKFMADFGGMWGWQTDYFDDGTLDYYGMACDIETEIDNGAETVKISPILAKKIYQWQSYFEDNYNPLEYSDKLDLNCYNKTGERLTELLKKQIGNLYDEIYYHPLTAIMRAKANKHIFVVCADFACCWGWIRDDDNSCANEFICDLNGDELEIDKSISDEFYAWQRYFEYEVLDNPNFDWGTFNKKGEELTEKLKNQIGHLFEDVVYETPYEYQMFLEKGIVTI